MSKAIVSNWSILTEEERGVSVSYQLGAYAVTTERGGFQCWLIQLLMVKS